MLACPRERERERERERLIHPDLQVLGESRRVCVRELLARCTYVHGVSRIVRSGHLDGAIFNPESAREERVRRAFRCVRA